MGGDSASTRRQSDSSTREGSTNNDSKSVVTSDSSTWNSARSNCSD